MNLQNIELSEIEQPDWLWSQPEQETLHILAASLAHSGQLRPIHVVAIPENFQGQRYMVVDGVTVIQAASLAGIGILKAVIHSERSTEAAMALAVELNLCGGEFRSTNKCHAALSAVLGKLAETMNVQPLTTMHPLDLASYIELYKQGFDWKNYSGPPRQTGNMNFDFSS